jgi:1-acyl-sn-glycerol-3-phosphate acyltransferase
MIGPLLAAFVRILCGAQAYWQGIAPDQRQRIYFANHTSNLDALVLWAALPPELRELTHPVAARDYWLKRAVRRYLAQRVFRAVLIDRHKVTAGDHPIEAMITAMGDRHSLIIFPEGGRFPGPEPRPFKSGLFHLAKRLPSAELVPVYLENLNRVLPKGEFLPVPFLSSMTLGAPLQRIDGEAKPDFLKRARLAVWNLRHT